MQSLQMVIMSFIEIDQPENMGMGKNYYNIEYLFIVIIWFDGTISPFLPLFNFKLVKL